MKQVTVRYFASFREACGTAQEPVETEAATLAGLFDEIAQRHPLPLGREHCRAALNDAFADWNDPFDHGDRIALIPPVAGG